MRLSSRIPFVFGIGFTAMVLAIGCLAARVTTITCSRNGAELQGICRLEQSTLFLPWNKTVAKIQLKAIQKAEVVELGVDRYTVVLRLRNDAPNFLLHQSEYAENAQKLARHINAFLGNPKAKGVTMQEGGGLQETMVLLSSLAFGLFFIWAGIRSKHQPDAGRQYGEAIQKPGSGSEE